MRAAQRYLATANVTIFTLVLCFLVFLNLGGSPEDRLFDWHVVRYQTQSANLVEPLGSCSGLKTSKKPALVVSHVASDGDTKWLEQLSPSYHLCVYDVDQSGTYQNGLVVPANRGHEAMAYLTFIIDNYDNIPDAGAVFVHGSRYAWHNDAQDYDNAALLASLNVSAALKPHGYHNMRCDWSASTCDLSTSPAQGSLETIFKAKLQPWDTRAVSDVALMESLVALFGNGIVKDVKPSRTHAIRSQCCAQFVVSRQSIRQHSQGEYIAIRQWLLDGTTSSGRSGAPVEDKVAGRVLSYVWHILFMRGENETINLKDLNANACPSAADCYCRLYGRCDLQQCAPGWCPGQYTIPPGYKIPDDWEATHMDMT